MPSVAALIVPSFLVLVTHAKPNTPVTYTCAFESGVIVIDHSAASGQVKIQIDGIERLYVAIDQKLIPVEAGLPSYYFQSELKRWKRLDDNGETVETTVCKERYDSRSVKGVHDLH
ncbi:MAG: hypothetical protein DI537_35265 [Stutzerimonas stutzeri]|nr:MAG: hypothetical protein DI537_35265 [Stutzerimonas stutzeri]